MKRLLTLFLALALAMLSALVVIPAAAEPATGTIPPDTSWYDASATNYELGNAAQFLGFLQLAQTNNFEGKTVTLSADIDLNPGADLAPTFTSNPRQGGGTADPYTIQGDVTLPTAPANVWSAIPVFSGTLDGAGHTLSGAYYTVDITAATVIGLITTLKGSVRNLIMDNSFVYAYSTGNYGSCIGGCTIGGLVGTADANSSLETLYLDLNVFFKGWSGETVGGVVGKILSNPVTIRDVVFAGCAGGFHPEMHYPASTPSVLLSQLIGDQNWKSGLVLSNVAMLGTPIIRDDSKNPFNLAAAKNQKLSLTDMTTRPANILYGKFATVEAAKNAGAITNYNESVTTVDMVYSAYAGSIVPTTVANMLNSAIPVHLVATQRSKTSYTVHAGTENEYTGQSLRFVAVLTLSEKDLKNYSKVGFLIQINEGTKSSYIVKEGGVVYTGILADGVAKSAQEYGGNYIVALSLENVPIGAEIELTVTPYLVDNTNARVNGKAGSVTVLSSGEIAD